MIATQEQAVVLEAFEQALRREVHNLAGRPDLFWQQLCNRLQWSEGSVQELVDTEADRRATDSDAPIWFWTRTPFREAEGLLRTLDHGAPVRILACALTPSGAWLSSSSDDGSLRLWNTRTGVELGRVDDSDDPIVSCAFDCDGSFLVTGSRRGRVQIRDARTLAELVELHGDGEEAHCRTSPVEPLAAIASGTALRLIELPSGHELVSSSAEDGAFSCCAFSGGGELIVTGDDAGTQRIWVWAPPRLDEKGCVKQAHAGPIRGCAVSPNFSVHVTAGDDKLIMWGFGASGELQQAWFTQPEQVNDCGLSPDGQLMISVSDDRTTWIRRLDDLKGPVSVLEGHSGPVNRCALAANGSVLATASQDGTVKLWDPWRGLSRGGIAGHRNRVTAIAFAPDGTFIVSGSADMTLKTWDPAPTAERSTFEGHLGPVWDCMVLKQNGLLASAAHDGTVRLWDIESAKEAQVLQVGGFADVHALASNRNGSLLAVSHDSSLSLWDLASGRRISGVDAVGTGPGDRLWDCAFTPDGGHLLLACEDATLRLWDVAAWREQMVLRGHAGSVSCCAAIPDTPFVVSGSQDGTLRLWDIDSGTEVHIFRGHTDAVWDCAVSADGAFMVSVGGDGNLRIWSIASRAPIGTFSVPVGLCSVAVHPSEPRVACGDVHGWVRVVDVMNLHLPPAVAG